MSNLMYLEKERKGNAEMERKKTICEFDSFNVGGQSGEHVCNRMSQLNVLFIHTC